MGRFSAFVGDIIIHYQKNNILDIPDLSGIVLIGISLWVSDVGWMVVMVSYRLALIEEIGCYCRMGLVDGFIYFVSSIWHLLAITGVW